MLNGKIYTVSEINRFIKGLFDERRELLNVQIAGELSNFRKYPSGHCYFNLKDNTGVLKAVMFAGNARNLNFSPHNGDSIVAIGRIGVYERDGVYQLYVDILLPQGTGSLMLAFEQLKQKLLQEGLFDAARKRSLPLRPHCIGIITSAAGAAVHDIIKVSRQRDPSVRLIIYPVRVQGKEAVGEIVAAISFMNKESLADVLIVGRGGGSLEDLWAFNEEAVVRAIAASVIPVVSAVGHETDFSLSDFVADVRAATPSQAAELVTTDMATFAKNIARAERRLLRLIQQQLRHYSQQLKVLNRSWVFTQPERWLEDKQQQIDGNSAKLAENMEKTLKDRQHALELYYAKLIALNPLSILQRGYSLTESDNGKLITHTSQVLPGMVLKTHLGDGLLISEVKSIRKAESE